MRLIASLIVLALLVSLGVVAEESTQPQVSFPRDVTELSTEEVELLWREFESQSRANAETSLQSVPRQEKHEYSGEWNKKNGSRICDGYLTRNADEQYCSREIPSDWRSFEFEGGTYYFAPIERDQKRNSERPLLAVTIR